MSQRRTDGFTLIEVLMSLAIAGIVIGLVISFLPKAAGQSTERALDTQALTRANKLVSIIDAQFRPDIGAGTFAGFSLATASQLNAAFLVDGGTLIPPMLEANRNIHELRTVRIPGFQPVIGQDYLVLGTKGIAKLITATGVSGDMVTFNCPLGIRSDGDMLLFKARGLELKIEDGQLFRTVGGRREALAPAEGLAFKYVYANDAGTLTDSPTGTPLTTNAGNLVAFYPSAITADRRGDRTTAIPTTSDNITRLLTCEELAVKTPDEARINASILGLPSGATPDVMIYGPDRDINGTRVPRTQAYIGVDAGEYRLEARDVTFEGRVYKASVGGSPQRLWNTWGSINMAARYALTQGTLHLQTSGLPAGSVAIADITGPNGYTNTVQVGADSSLDLLVEAGTYTITPRNVTGSDFVYVASAQNGPVSDGQITTVPLAYTPITGGLELDVRGLPSGVSAAVALNGPSPTNTNVMNGITRVNYLAAGNYTYTPSQTLAQSKVYNADAGTFTMVNGKVTRVEIIFIPVEEPAEPNAITITLTPRYSQYRSFTYNVDNLTTGERFTATIRDFAGNTAIPSKGIPARPPEQVNAVIKTKPGNIVITQVPTPEDDKKYGYSYSIFGYDINGPAIGGVNGPGNWSLKIPGEYTIKPSGFLNNLCEDGKTYDPALGIGCRQK